MGQHVQEVLTDDLGVDVHIQTVGAFTDEVPAVVVGLAAGVVEHKDLVQSLQGQEALVVSGGGAVGIGPILGDEGVQNAGSDHLGLDLVAVLDQGHGEGAGFLQGVSGQLVKDLVVLGLLPLEVQGVVGVDGLQIRNEQRQSGLTTAGVAHAVEHLAVGLFNGLASQLFQSHALGLLDDLLGFGQFFLVCGGSTASDQAHNQAQCQQQRDQFFHNGSSS